MEYRVFYTQTHQLMRHDGDFLGRMKPGALLRYAQQLATDQAAQVGLDDAFYEKNHLVYLLAKQELEFYRVPRVDEMLTYTTIPECSHRACNKRLTIVTDAAGREVALVDSRWVLVDTESRRIVRRPPEMIERLWNPQVERELEQRIPKAEALGGETLRRAEYSVCDINGHVNNTAYIDMVCDLIPLERMRKAPIRRAAISYHKEIPMGQSFALKMGECEGGYYVCGTREEMPAFEAWCGF